MAYSEIKTLIFLTVKSVSLRIRIYYDNNFNNYFLSSISSAFFSFSFFFCMLYFFFSYIPFKFTYVVCGRGLQGQWLLSHALLTYNRNSHLFHSFIHFSQNARQWATKINKLQSLFWNTASLQKTLFYHTHEDSRGPTHALYIFFRPNGKTHLTRRFSGNLQLQCNKCVGTELESLWHLTEYQWNCYAQLQFGLCKITSQKMNGSVSTAMKW